jgi:hypothetical protein
MKKTEETVAQKDTLSVTVNRIFPDKNETEKQDLIDTYNSLIIGSLRSTETPETVYARAKQETGTGARRIFSPEREIQLAAALALYNVDNRDPEKAIGLAREYFGECAKQGSTADSVLKSCNYIADPKRLHDLYQLVQETKKKEIEAIRIEWQKQNQTFTQTFKSAEQKQHDRDDVTEQAKGKSHFESGPRRGESKLEQICGTDYEFMKNMLSVVVADKTSIIQNIPSESRDEQEVASYFLGKAETELPDKNAAAQQYFVLFNWYLHEGNGAKAKEMFEKGYALIAGDPNAMALQVHKQDPRKDAEILSYFGDSKRNLDRLVEKFPLYLKLREGGQFYEEIEEKVYRNKKEIVEKKRMPLWQKTAWVLVVLAVIAGASYGILRGCTPADGTKPTATPTGLPTPKPTSTPTMKPTPTPTPKPTPTPTPTPIPTPPKLTVVNLEKSLSFYGDTIWNEVVQYVTEVLGYAPLPVVNDYFSIVLTHNNLTPEQAQSLDLGAKLNFPKLDKLIYDGKFRLLTSYNSAGEIIPYIFYEEQLY